MLIVCEQPQLINETELLARPGEHYGRMIEFPADGVGAEIRCPTLGMTVHLHDLRHIPLTGSLGVGNNRPKPAEPSSFENVISSTAEKGPICPFGVSERPFLC